MTQQKTMKVSTREGYGGNSPPSSPPKDSRGGVMLHEPPNGGWSIPNSRWGTFVPSQFP
jgi:hypothetical protein